ncbi:DNA PHOTOLYASE [Salix viminalis]|uniref:DNA PHOTOLYASE n=1 Tax=Salix viminalis TaxID=40686 RepID=A0A9Q0SGR4_SALVM|nr:DNA PHOTOLYASE [Salix viminalis]
MALLSLPRSLFSHSLSSPSHAITSRRNRCFSCSLSVSKTSNATSLAILWFKQDLRLDDHPGLLQASKFPALLPLYVFDHRILSRYNDEKLELVLYALEDLRKSLKKQGSNLMIRFGNAENVIKELVLESRIVGTGGKLPMCLRKWRWSITCTPFYDIKNLKVLPASYDEFEKLQLTVTPPLLPPRLPSAEMELDWGLLPTLDNLKKFVNDSPSKWNESWALLKEMSSETISQKQLSKSGKVSLNNSNFKHTKRKRLDKSVFVTQKQNIVGGGTNSVLNALAAYLRYLEGTTRDDWQEVHEKLRTAEIRDGASFFALFGPALCLGIISRRRVYHESIKYEKERNAGFLSPFGYSTATVSASADTVCSMEWYWLLLLRSQLSDGGAYPYSDMEMEWLSNSVYSCWQ